MAQGELSSIGEVRVKSSSNFDGISDEVNGSNREVEVLVGKGSSSFVTLISVCSINWKREEQFLPLCFYSRSE